MAKRKRLTPVPSGVGFDPVHAENAGIPAPETTAFLRPGLRKDAMPPIARAAAEAAAHSALEEMTAAMAQARAEGRLVQSLPLEAIDLNHLVRDRIQLDPEELGHLAASIRNHGQRTPIEVTELGDGRFGLISGWRRMQALRLLLAETEDRKFGSVLAILRRPTEASDAYVAMVEENEVRQGLSYYERARIAARAVEEGVFESEKQALQRLFSAASRARRSKIGSFLVLYHALDGTLCFPAAIPERLGLALAKHLEERPEAGAALRAALVADPAPTAEAELARLAAAINPGKTVSHTAESAPNGDTFPRRQELRPGVILEVSGGFSKPVLTLSGPAVGPGFREKLEHWLKTGS